jgi:hypothetical protein
VTQGGLNYEKSKGHKSRDTVPLRNIKTSKNITSLEQLLIENKYFLQKKIFHKDQKVCKDRSCYAPN